MYSLVNRTTYPGWGYMVDQGATTVWEAWSRSMSSAWRAESMAMFATIDEFFYSYLAGIKGPDYYGSGFMTPGFRSIEIKPHILGDLTSASASIKTVRGRLSSSWKRKGNSIILEVTIPANSQARVSMPKVALGKITVEESGKTIWKNGSYFDGVEGITDGSESAEYVIFDVGSGSYAFKVRIRTTS